MRLYFGVFKPMETPKLYFGISVLNLYRDELEKESLSGYSLDFSSH